ncbi:MAG: hypothetical protein IT494_05275 [Gammaproteobacteria bacterium]|nr:hypothetical protein [Gammaproteobacteria bacterium]
MLAGRARRRNGCSAGDGSLEENAARVLGDELNPTPRSGRQELLEDTVNRYR